jgi:hypothetical protein
MDSTSQLILSHSFLCCCSSTDGVMLNQLGPMGKVWENGSVQVVQSVENLSTDSHPRNKLGVVVRNF